MRSRMLSSFPFLLAGMLAVSAVNPPVTRLDCHKLDPKKNLLKQMKDCKGEMFEYLTDPTIPFELTGLDQATAEDLLYMKKTVNKTEVPDKDKPRKFKGSVTISDTTVEHLTLSMATTGSRQVVKIVHNPNLNTFTLRTDLSDLPDIGLTVKGNKQMSMLSIKKLSKVQGVKSLNIQEYKECYFDSKPIGSFSQLKGCTGVEGDLVIDSQTITGDMSQGLHISKIRNGCLRIENSNLTNLDFLKGLLNGPAPSACSKGGASSIKDNTKLCLTSEEQLKWEDYQLTYAGTCEDRCTPEFAVKTPNAPCTIVTGDVKITRDTAQLQIWNRVSVLEGTLEVDDTDLTEIVIFNNLVKIDNPSKVKRALTVTRNSKMEKFDLPSLVSIKQLPDAWHEPILFQQNSNNFRFTWIEYQRWQNITQNDLVSVPNVGPPIPPTTTSPPKPSTQSPEEVRRQNAINEEQNRNTELAGRLTIAAIIGGPTIAIIAICLGCGWVYYWKEKKALKKKRVDHDVVVKKSGSKASMMIQLEPAKMERPQVEKDELTVDTNAPDYELDEDEKAILQGLEGSHEEREYAKACQMARRADELPFKMSDMITNSTAEEFDFKQGLQSTLKEKAPPKSYRFIEKYRQLAYNPRHIKCQPTQYMEKFDPHAVLKILLTNSSEFFVTNAHLMPEIIKYLTGPHYGGKSKNLLAKIDGSVTCITDLHGMLDVLQVILNINFNEKKMDKVHPAFCQKYVILGDLVDRGQLGMECSIMMCLLARLFPGNFVILRGNHDQRMVPVEHNTKTNTINKWGEALKERGKLVNPHHFADCMYWDYLENVVAYMPFACLINGKVFACHGGMSTAMLHMTGTLDELFAKVPVPYLEPVHIKHDGYKRYYGEPESNNTPEKAAEHFKTTKPDEYSKRLDQRRADLLFFETGAREGCFEFERGYAAYLNEDRESALFLPDLRFELQHSWLFELLWSDPGTILASHGNPRGAGNIYSYENVATFCEKYGIEYIVRGHMMKFFVSPDGKVVNIYSNPYHLLGHFYLSHHEVKPQQMEPSKFATIVRINADGTRTLVFISLSWEKKPDQALLKMNKKIRRELGEYRFKMSEQRAAEWQKKTGKNSNKDMSNASLQSAAETDDKSSPEKNLDTLKSSPEKNLETNKEKEEKLETGKSKGTEKKSGKKSEKEKSQVKSPSGQEGKMSKNTQKPSGKSDKKK